MSGWKEFKTSVSRLAQKASQKTEELADGTDPADATGAEESADAEATASETATAEEPTADEKSEKSE